MNAAFHSHLVLQQGIHHAVSGRLHLGTEGFRGDDDSEVRLLGRAAGHGLVMGMQARIIVDLEEGGLESLGDLGVYVSNVNLHTHLRWLCLIQASQKAEKRSKQEGDLNEKEVRRGQIRALCILPCCALRLPWGSGRPWWTEDAGPELRGSDAAWERASAITQYSGSCSKLIPIVECQLPQLSTAIVFLLLVGDIFVLYRASVVNIKCHVAASGLARLHSPMPRSYFILLPLFPLAAPETTKRPKCSSNYKQLDVRDLLPACAPRRPEPITRVRGFGISSAAVLPLPVLSPLRRLPFALFFRASPLPSPSPLPFPAAMFSVRKASSSLLLCLLRHPRAHPRPQLVSPLSSSARMRMRTASTLPRLPLFKAIAAHDPKSTAVVHSVSGRSFTYGELLGDVAEAKDKLLQEAGGSAIDGHRIAFLVENSYDYIGVHREFSFYL